MMQLRMTYIDQGQYREARTLLEVRSDDAGEHGQYFRRMIVATIREHSSGWHRCIDCLKWQPTSDVDGRSFSRGLGVQVNHDFYSFIGGFFNVDGDTVRLILLERFEGSRDEYYERVEERNKRVHCQITRNEIRELIGLPPGSEPELSESPPSDQFQSLRDAHFYKAAGLGLSRNNII
jgi:hypothetical protein